MTFKRLIKKLVSNTWGDFAINFVIVLAFTLTLSWLLDHDPYSLIEGTTDFNSGDYYDRVYHDNARLPIDGDMVIVASDQISNEELPEVLRLIGDYGAKAIGFDLIFRNESSITVELIDVIDSLPQIVMPVELDYDDLTGRIVRGAPSLLDEYMDGKIEATVSFPPRPVMSYQRDMFLNVPVENDDTLQSFAMMLAMMKNPDIEIPRGMATEAINFNISEVEVISYDEFMDPDLHNTIETLINGRIVLVGDVANKYDVHPTAVDESMPGIKLHAAGIATLLNNRPVKPLGRLWSILFILLCVAVVTAVDSYFSDKDDFRKGITFLAVKGFFLVLMLLGGYALYIYCGVCSDFTYSVTLFMFSMVIADLWFGLRDYLSSRNKNKHDKNKQDEQSA